MWSILDQAFDLVATMIVVGCAIVVWLVTVDALDNGGIRNGVL
jgi:hypothetical protein